MKILLNGYKGRMGQAIISAANGTDLDIAFKTDIGDDASQFIKDCDAAIDFSFRDATYELAKLCAQNKKPLIIGTTGHTPEQREKILECTKDIAIVWAGNYSIGVNLLNYLIKIATSILPDTYDIEIVEMHHRLKKDAPSGTAEKLLKIAQSVRGIKDDEVTFGREGLVGERPNREIGVHSLRGGSVVGDHTVMFATDGERLELTHKAEDRKIFANGVVKATLWVKDKPAGLYGMEDVLGLK